MTFTCCICGHVWQPADPKDARHIAKGIEVNKTGPYCELCRALETARRVAEARRFNFSKFVKSWLPLARRYEDKQHTQYQSHANNPEHPQPARTPLRAL